jgi:hypothetical protein
MLVVHVALIIFFFKCCLHLIVQERICLRIWKWGVSSGHGVSG